MVEGVKNLKEDRRRARQAVAQVRWRKIASGLVQWGSVFAFRSRSLGRVW